MFRIVALLFLTHFSLHVNSQERFNAGLMVGLVGSQISGDNLGGFHKAGLQGGAFSSFWLGENWDLHTEIYYVQKGSRMPVDPESFSPSLYRLRLHYIEVPVIARYYQGKFLFEAGLSGGALFKFREEDASGIIPPTIPFNRSEVAGHLGVGTSLGKRFTMIWRYSNSLLPVRGHASGATFRFNRGQYNSVLYFVFQYSLRDRSR